jgi:hypothetical protein
MDERNVQTPDEVDGVWDARTDGERAEHDGENYLVSVSLNVSAASPREAAQEFLEWFATTKHPTVTVNPIPFPAGGVVEVTL